MSTGEYIEDLPNPDLAELQQREVLAPVLLVRPDGPVSTQPLPARTGPIETNPLTTTFQRVLNRDFKRSRAVLICDVDWLISRSNNAAGGAPWYAKVPLVLTHRDDAYAAVPTDTGTLTVITEIWAD